MDIDLISRGALARDRAGGFYEGVRLTEKDKKNPKKIAAMFESIFYRMLFKQMRESSVSQSIFDSSQMRMVQEMQDDEFSSYLGARGDLGVAKVLMDFMEKSASEKVVSPGNFEERFSLKEGLLKD